jgi:hypothetical protein
VLTELTGSKYSDIPGDGAKIKTKNKYEKVHHGSERDQKYNRQNEMTVFSIPDDRKNIFCLFWVSLQRHESLPQLKRCSIGLGKPQKKCSK